MLPSWPYRIALSDASSCIIQTLFRGVLGLPGGTTLDYTLYMPSKTLELNLINPPLHTRIKILQKVREKHL